MSEHEVRLVVNGVPRDVTVPRAGCSRTACATTSVSPARTSAASTACAARAPCSSTARRCARACCSRCPSTAPRSRPSRVWRTTNGELSPVQQAFRDCHGLQCGFCTPGFLTTITAGLRENPDPSEDEAREMIGGNLCRCTGLPEHREVGPARGRDREGMTTQAVRRADPARRGRRAWCAGAGGYLDDLGQDALAAAFVRSPHAHARILDIDVSAAIDVDGLVAIYTWEDLPGRIAEPLPLLIPHPTLTHGRTPYALARDEVNHVGEAVVMVVARDRYVAEDAVERIVVTYEPLPAVVGVAAARDANASCTRTSPATSPRTWCRSAATPPPRSRRHRTSSNSTCRSNGRRRRRSRDAACSRGGTPSPAACASGRRRRPRPGCALPSPRSWTCRSWPSTSSRPTWAGDSASRSCIRGRRRSSCRGRRACSSSRSSSPRTAASTSSRSAHERAQLHHVRVGFDDEGHLLGLDVRFWHDHGAYIPYGLIVPIITSTQLLGPYKPGAYRVEFDSLYTNTVIVTPYRGAGRPQGAFVMERVMDAIARELGARPHRSCASGTSSSPTNSPTTTG